MKNVTKMHCLENNRSSRIVKARKPMWRKRRGSALVEFALVAPLLILLTMVMVQFGIILNTRIALNSLCRQAARFAAVNATDATPDTNIKTQTSLIAQRLGITNFSNSNVTIAGASENPTSTETNRKRYITSLTMTITYDMTGKYFLPTKFFGLPITRTNYSSTTTFICE